MDSNATIDGVVSIFWIAGRARPIPVTFAEGPEWDVLEPIRLIQLQVSGMTIGHGRDELQFVGGRIVGDAKIVSVLRGHPLADPLAEVLEEEQVLHGIVQPLLDLSEATQTLIFVEHSGQAARLDRVDTESQDCKRA